MLDKRNLSMAARTNLKRLHRKTSEESIRYELLTLVLGSSASAILHFYSCIAVSRTGQWETTMNAYIEQVIVGGAGVAGLMSALALQR